MASILSVFGAGAPGGQNLLTSVHLFDKGMLKSSLVSKRVFMDAKHSPGSPSILEARAHWKIFGE
ncbi:hypothetical protein FH972_027220 [Carpinus fangiana]|uniref:Uncharacterized protein n=1 Tax=Carpinus fangiana TaxID=176857 RepID=A0A5N6L736_9ROSI|nr:hypothetical protein FH972_027220 [Carpinus fangiana]